MSLLQYVRNALFNTDDRSSTETLRELFSEREATLDLQATFTEPEPNLVDEPSVVFHFGVQTADGELYGTGKREFLIPDDGTGDNDSPLVQFVASHTDVDPDEVTFDTLMGMAGVTTNASLNERGTIELGDN